jgi:spermidine synthase
MPLHFSEVYPEVKSIFESELKKVLYSMQSPYQQIDIIETYSFGKVLLLDGMIMLTEKDEFVYHEMISHVPLFVHPEPKNILIIGGGDGGTVRECLKHPEIQKIDLVEIDQMVTQACLKYTPSLSETLFAEQVSCIFQDAVKFVKKSNNKYDIIIIDSTDPINVGEGLFTLEFYQNCSKILSDDGILVAQSETPIWLPKLTKGIAKKLRATFPGVYFYQANIPTYPSGYWSFAFASKKYNPVKDFNLKNYKELNLPFKYYNCDLHKAAFTLPSFFKELIHEA